MHVKMFDKRKEPTMHRIYVEWEGGFFIVLGSTCEAFQSMVEDMGRPKKVEFLFPKKVFKHVTHLFHPDETRASVTCTNLFNVS